MITLTEDQSNGVVSIHVDETFTFLKSTMESYDPAFIRQRINEVIIQKIQNEIIKHQPKQILKG